MYLTVVCPVEARYVSEIGSTIHLLYGVYQLCFSAVCAIYVVNYCR